MGGIEINRVSEVENFVLKSEKLFISFDLHNIIIGYQITVSQPKQD